MVFYQKLLNNINIATVNFYSCFFYKNKVKVKK